jgi:thymidine phosphorylase
MAQRVALVRGESRSLEPVDDRQLEVRDATAGVERQEGASI